MFEKGKSITKQQVQNGEIPVVAGGRDYAYFHNIANREADVITISASGANAGFVNFWNRPIWASDCSTIKSNNKNIVNIHYIYEILSALQKHVYNLQKGNAQPHVYIDDIKKIKIPLPPLDIQQKIVDEIEEVENFYQQHLQKKNLLIEQIEKIANRSFKISYKTKQIGQISKVLGGKRIPKTDKLINEQTKHPYIRVISFAETGNIDKTKLSYIANETYNKIANYIINAGNIYISIAGTIGKVGMLPVDLDGANLTENAAKIVLEDEFINNMWLVYLLRSKKMQNLIKNLTHGAGTPKLSLDRIKHIAIPVPPLEEQQKIVSQIEELEKQIAEAQAIIDNSKQQKQEILDKYLK